MPVSWAVLFFSFFFSDSYHDLYQVDWLVSTYLLCVIDKVIKKYLDYKFSSNQNQLKVKSEIHYFIFSYIGNLSRHINNKLLKLCKEFCKENFNIKLVFNSFKIKDYFSYKDTVPNDLKSYLINLLLLAVVLVILAKRVVISKLGLRSISKKDNKSHIFKHLHSTAACFDSYDSLCFKIIDKAKSKFDLIRLKIKEALRINSRKPNITTQ